MKQNLVDVAQFTATGGKGGDGAISWRREKFIPKGGPDGGEGGKGGTIILKASKHLNTLRFFAGKDRFLGPMGSPGSKRGSDGRDAEDMVIEVPMGTVVAIAPTDYRLLPGRTFYGEGYEAILHSGMKIDSVPYLIFDERWPATHPRGESSPHLGGVYVPVVDLKNDGQELVIARGGRGGKGNKQYKSSIMTTPKFAQKGELGERFLVKLELKVLADVGLVGMPNVGKSTLLSVLTAARPEIANYPFTTLSPNLGVMEGGKPLVIADIPGLIEDAHKGKGLGVDFLRHVERCKVLVYVLAQDVGELWEQYQTVIKEVESYSVDLVKKPSLVVVNKLDTIYEIRDTIYEFFKNKGVDTIIVSAATHESLEELKSKIIQLTS